MANELTKPESSRRTALERTIRQAGGAILAAGKALIEIRDTKLYRSTHKTFEAYCRDVWSWSKQRAYQLMGAAELVKALPAKSQPVVDSERKARALIKVPPGKLHEVVEHAAATGATTAKQIAAVVETVTQPELTDANGTPIPKELREDWLSATVIGKLIRSAGLAFKRVVDVELEHGDKYKQKHNLSDQMSKDIGDLVYEMSRCIPHAVCPFCEGKGKRCDKCHSRGWVSKQYWNQFVPAKFKKNAQPQKLSD